MKKKAKARRPSRVKSRKPSKEKPMTTEVAVQAPEPLALTAVQIRTHINLIQQVLKSVMKKDVHYGIIPGTTKPTLYKPGAEYIMVLFRLNGKPIIEDLSTEDAIRYRVSIQVTHQITKNEIGWGVGECSSDEEKYKWKKCYVEEYNATPEDRRRLKYYPEGKPAMQVRANPADIANTILKMAKKRALTDATLTCTAASDVFDQDLEDLPEGMRQSVADSKKPTMPQRAADKPPVAAEDESQEPPPEKKANLGNARPMAAKFDAPCKLCGNMLKIGEDILYVGDGPDKGRYCVSHRA